MKLVFSTEKNEVVVAMIPFKSGLMIATSLRVLYYGPDETFKEIKP